MWKLEIKQITKYNELEFEFETLEEAVALIEKASNSSCDEIEFKLWKEGEKDESV